jgi:membrane associated rhomboid family serine protease
VIPIGDELPTRRAPVATWAILTACVAVFLWQVSLDERDGVRAIHAFGMIPATLFGQARLAPELARVPPELTVLTSLFLHGGWLHLLGNLLYLWVFGNNVEDAMGRLRYSVFYAVCGVAAALAQAVPAPDSPVPMVGASGAISGVLGAYLLLFPRARVRVFAPSFGGSHTVRLPAAWVLLTWFLLQLVPALTTSGDEGGIAFGAHVGGFAAGVLLVPLFKRADIPLLGRRR